jgi:hypothetical protein
MSSHHFSAPALFILLPSFSFLSPPYFVAQLLEQAHSDVSLQQRRAHEASASLSTLGAREQKLMSEVKQLAQQNDRLELEKVSEFFPIAIVSL